MTQRVEEEDVRLVELPSEGEVVLERLEMKLDAILARVERIESRQVTLMKEKR